MFVRQDDWYESYEMWKSWRGVHTTATIKSQRKRKMIEKKNRQKMCSNTHWKRNEILFSLMSLSLVFRSFSLAFCFFKFVCSFVWTASSEQNKSFFFHLSFVQSFILPCSLISLTLISLMYQFSVAGGLDLSDVQFTVMKSSKE